MSQTRHMNEVFKSRNTILELLKEQGYDISNYEGSSLTEVNSMFTTKQMDMLLTKEDGKKCYVKYHLAKALRINNIYDYIEDLMNLEDVLSKSDDLIIIVNGEPNESLLKAMKNYWEQEGVFVVVFYIKRLQFNIMNHDLVPRHVVLTEEETEQFKKKFKITDNKQIPDISRFSPMSLAIGLRPGQICKIIRPSRTAIETPFYRICTS